MKLLIIEKTIEGQTVCFKRVEGMNRSDIEVLDLCTKMTTDKDYKNNLQETEVAILGSGLAQEAIQIARQIRFEAPWVHIVMYVTKEAYQGGGFRTAYDAGARKVLSDASLPVDLLQELIAINAEFRKEGRAREGKLVCVAHAKGGVGATSICAAIAEVCSVFHKRTLLWDFDIETRDLCRSLTVNGPEAKVVTSWVNGSQEVTRETLANALISISEDVSVLMPPDGFAEGIDLACHTDSIQICQRVVDVAKMQNDVLLVDTGGRLGPATGTLMRVADEVVVVIDETVLGLTALDLFLNYVKHLVLSPERISFLVNGYSGSVLAISQMEAELEPVHHLGSRPWRLSPLPFDPKASQWAGSGKTLYSLGQRPIRSALEQIAIELQLITGEVTTDSRRNTPWWGKLLNQ